MKGLHFVLLFTAMTFISWGTYGPVLRHGTHSLSNDSLRAFVGVGLAYFLIAVLIPLVLLRQNKESGSWTTGGVFYSLVAGTVGALGALGVILALANGGDPVYVMPIVFGFAPVVNTLVTAWIGKTFSQIRPVFIGGIVTAALGAVGVLVFQSHVAPKPVAQPEVKPTAWHVELNHLIQDGAQPGEPTQEPKQEPAPQEPAPQEPTPKPANEPAGAEPKPTEPGSNQPGSTEPTTPAQEPAKPSGEPPKPADEPAKPAQEPPKPGEEPPKSAEIPPVQENPKPSEAAKATSAADKQIPEVNQTVMPAPSPDSAQTNKPAATDTSTPLEKEVKKTDEEKGESVESQPVESASKSGTTKQRNTLAIVLSIIMAAVCWGSYGPMLHIGQSKMSGSRLRPFMCVGIAYFLIAVLVPLLLIFNRADDSGSWTPAGMTWSFFAGVAGALGALGVILAFNAGGKPIYVMPLVFGFAPVINTSITLSEKNAWGSVPMMFWVSLAVVIAGAVTVLITAPKPKPKPGH